MRKRKIKEIIFDGEVAYIPLTKGFFATIDSCDAHLVSGFNWHADKGGRVMYARRQEGSGSRKRFHLHRVIMGYEGEDPIDHIDGDGLNNRRSNLRVCSNAENIRNQGFRCDNKSGVKGVYWSNEAKKWKAKIMVNYKNIYLGYFSDINDAAKAYEAAAKKYFGDFSRVCIKQESV